MGAPARRGRMPVIAAIAGTLAAASCNDALGIDDFSADGCPFPGAKRCAGKTVQLCGDDGAWRDERTCPDACHVGSCVAECNAGQRRCAGSAPQECGPGGQWDLPLASCPEDAPCAGGMCGAVCVPGDLRCDDGKSQACDEAGQWRGDVVCSKRCIAGLCSECEPGERACENNTPRECNVIGQWEIGAACGKDKQCSESGACEQK